MNNKTYLKELFECLEVLNDYWTTYDTIEDRESKVATVPTQKMVELHEAYNRCKEQAHEMNHYFMPMDSAPIDGTAVLLMMNISPYPSVGYYEERNDQGWSILSGFDGLEDCFCVDDAPINIEFIGWFPLPKLQDGK